MVVYTTTTNGNTSAIYPYFMGKNIFPYTFWCYKICRETFLQTEEAHSSEQKLV